MAERYFLTRVWAFDADGKKVFPYTGIRGANKGLYSVNFTSDTKNYEGMDEAELVGAIENGRFQFRGSIRMLPLGADTSQGNNAFVPRFLDGVPIPRK